MEDELKTYIIIVNDDGSLTLDQNGQLVEDADPQTVIPVHLPVNKMKSMDCPLPGAIPLQGSSRTRKTKPQAVLYGDNDNSMYNFVPANTTNFSPLEFNVDQGQHVVNGTGVIGDPNNPVVVSSNLIPSNVSSVAQPPAAIDIEQLGQLGPQDMAILENVLQSEQAREVRELLENLTFPNPETSTTNPSPSVIVPGNHLWDHSYSAVFHSPPASTSSTSSLQHPSVETQLDGRVPTKKLNVPVNQPAKSIFKVTFNNSTETPVSAPTAGLPGSVLTAGSTTTTQTNRRISEGDSSANIRRSQRQQDRIERQEAERIMAENQQMLQREKELMMENSGVIVVNKPETPPPTAAANQNKVVTLNSSGSSIEMDVQDISIQSITPIKTPEDSLRSDGTRRPARQRKLPAHLADPNYVRLEDETKSLIRETVVSKSEDEDLPTEGLVIAHDVQEAKDISSDDDADDGDEEDVGEDDPNKLWCICRQPHNNRFMICCDKCDDWFHGKCVGVSKVQAQAWEQKNIQWHCPNCKKVLKQTPASARGRHPGRPSGSGTRRVSETSASAGESPQSKLYKSNQLKKQFKKGSLETHTPKRRDSGVKPGPRRPDQQPMKKRQPSTGEGSRSTACIICGKRARPNSVYCSDDCVRQYANNTRQKDSSTTNTPTNSSAPSNAAATGILSPPGNQQKLKRLNSTQEKAKDVEPFFAFHVIQSGAAKSTEVVPPRQKEPPSQKPPGQQSTPSASANSTPVSGNVTPKSPTKGMTPNQTNHQNSGAKSSSSGGGSSKHTVALKDGSEKLIKKKDVPTKDKTAGRNSDHRRSSSLSNSEKSTPKEKKKVKPKESPKDLEKERDAVYGRDGESLTKENMRKAIRESLKMRLKDMTDEEKASFPATNTPEYMAERIEAELTSLYGGVNNMKCKAKYRSIYFNLRDAKNSLFREILQGNIQPKTLVKMEPTEMASAELAEWRNRENQKNLEMIKRAELDKLAEAKKQELLDKGADVDAVVVAEEQTRKLDIADVIGTKDTKETSEKVEGDTSDKSASKSHSSHHRKDKKRDKDSKDKHRDSKYRHSSSSSSKDRDKRSEKHRYRRRDEDSRSREKEGDSRSKEKEGDSRSKEKEGDSRSKEKEGDSRSKEKEGDPRSKEKDVDKDKLEKDKATSKDKSKSSVDKDQSRKDRDRDSKRDSSGLKRSNSSREERRDKDSKILKHTDSNDKLDVKASSVQEESGSNEDSLHSTPIYSSSESSSNQFGTDSSSVISKQEEPSKNVVRYSTDSEQEMPSSTIKTPDFTDDKKEKPIFRTKFVMHELGHFGAGVYHVSHHHLDGIIFPESPVPIVGRISPETVWDYIDKMKKTKEVIVLRLAPDTPADAEGYMTFFTYLSSRGRLGVMGGLISPLKDVYLVPLDKHSPVNRALLPFRGPGLRKDRNHCLLAVVTRHIVQIPPMVQVKRKASISNSSPSLSPLPTPPKKKKVSDSSSGSSTIKEPSGLPVRHPQTSPISSTPGSSRLISSPNSFAVPTRKSITEGLSGSSTKGVEEKRSDDEPSVSKPTEDELNKDDDDEPYTPWEDEADDSKKEAEERETDDEPVIISSKLSGEDVNKDDDDEPYTPWEDDAVDEDVIILDSGSSSSLQKKKGPVEEQSSAQQLLAQLNTQIQREKQEIESIAVAIQRNETLTHIPGLDREIL